MKRINVLYAANASERNLLQPLVGKLSILSVVSNAHVKVQECQLQDHLAYLCNKNLASLAFENNQYPISLKLYASALKYDTTDVLIWYHMGQCAMENGE